MWRTIFVCRQIFFYVENNFPMWTIVVLCSQYNYIFLSGNLCEHLFFSMDVLQILAKSYKNKISFALIFEIAQKKNVSKFHTKKLRKLLMSFFSKYYNEQD